MALSSQKTIPGGATVTLSEEEKQTLKDELYAKHWKTLNQKLQKVKAEGKADASLAQAIVDVKSYLAEIKSQSDESGFLPLSLNEVVSNFHIEDYEEVFSLLLSYCPLNDIIYKEELNKLQQAIDPETTSYRHKPLLIDSFKKIKALLEKHHDIIGSIYRINFSALQEGYMGELKEYIDGRTKQEESSWLQFSLVKKFASAITYTKDDKTLPAQKMYNFLNGDDTVEFSSTDSGALTQGTLGGITERYRLAGLPIDEYFKHKPVAFVP